MYEFDIEELEKQQNELEIKAEKHKMRRDDYNSQVLSFRKERDEINRRKKIVYVQIESSRADREKYNKLARDAKKRRKIATNNYNTERESDNPDEQELKRMREISDSVHQEVIESADAAQEAHDLMGKLRDDTKRMNVEHQTAHTNFANAKKKADEAHQLYLKCMTPIYAIKRIIKHHSINNEEELTDQKIDEFEPLTQEQIEKLQDVVLGFYDEKYERLAESITSICVEGEIVIIELMASKRKLKGKFIGKKGIIIKELKEKLNSEFNIRIVELLSEGEQQKSEKYNCPICGQLFLKSKDINNHMNKTGHGVKRCVDCSIIIPSERDEEGHTEITGHANFSGEYIDIESMKMNSTKLD